MDVIRRSTDYALRAMVTLAAAYGGKPISARVLAKQEDVSYQLICKLLQRLHNAGYVRSLMGPSGGYRLAKAPSEITLAEIVNTLQGPVTINRCVQEDDSCPRKPSCAISATLQKIQKTLEDYLTNITLEKLLEENKDCDNNCDKG